MKEKNQKNEVELVKGGRFNLQVIHSIEIHDRDLEFMHITSSDILVGRFTNVCFYNASFLSTKLSDVTFSNSNLKSTDICSILAKNCIFQNVDFSNATISDSTFIHCKFDQSMFNSVSLTRCQFIDCTFVQFPMDDSTFSLNTFTRCHINKTAFTESFYYQIFDECIFCNVKMDPQLLGFNFGFSSSVFERLSDGADLNLVETDFIKKGLFINAAIFRINQIHKFYDEALIACVAALCKMIEDDILIKTDEIEFLENLTMHLRKNRQLAPISILRIWKLMTNAVVDPAPNTAKSKAIPHIRRFVNTLYLCFQDFQNELQGLLAKVPKFFDVNRTAELSIVYTEKPSVPFLECLIELSRLADPNCPMPRLLRTETGSFHEFHEIALIVIPYLQTFFSFLSVVAPFVIYKLQKKDQQCEKKQQGQTSKVDSDKIEPSVIKITLSPAQESQSLFLLPNNNIITPATNKIIYDVANMLMVQPIANNPAFCGYNTQNIRSITISFQ